MKDNYENLFAEIIWPAISGMDYDKAYQQGLFGDLANTMPELDSEGEYQDVDTTEIDIINDIRSQQEKNSQATNNNDDESDKRTLPNISRASLEGYYIKDNHTREETADRFNITENELDALLDKYDIRKRGA